MRRGTSPVQLAKTLAVIAIAVLVALAPMSKATAATGYVGSAVRPSADGYWLVTAEGKVSAFGAASHLGDMDGKRLNLPITGMASTATGKGYWLVAGDGGIFAFGDARFYGSTGSIKLNKPIVGMASTPSANGYWMVASDGGIFAYGDAPFFGSTGSIKLNQPITGMSPTSDGTGYWMVASDGGIFAFGTAGFFGSTGSMKLNQPVVSMSTSPSGKGYWLAAADGGIFAFGDAPFLGAGVSNTNSPTIAIVRDLLGGYTLVTAEGRSDRKPPRQPVNSPVVVDNVTTTTVAPTTTTVAPTTTTVAPTTAAPNTTTTVAPTTTTTAAPSVPTGTTSTTNAPTTTTTAAPTPTTTTTTGVPLTSVPTTSTSTTVAPTTTTTTVPALATSFKVDFGAQSSTPATGFATDYGQAFNGTSGWSNPFGAATSLVGNGRERNASSDQRVDTFMHMQLPANTDGIHVDGRWEHVVANGIYDVTVGVGDPSYTDSRNVISLEGTKVLDFTPSAGAMTQITTARITVNDGRLTVSPTGGTNTKISFVELKVASGPAPTTTTTSTSTTTTASPTTTTTAPPTTTPAAGPWSLVFNDDFNTNTPEGSFLNTYGSKWGAYQWGWLDTSKRGTYDPNILSVNNGMMNMRLHTTSDGKHHVAAPFPKLPGGNDQTYGRYEVRFRADAVPGYKTAWLLWPKSEVWPRDGEIDFPEGDLTGTIHAFMHRQGGTSGGDQDAFSTGARYTDWHTATLEWMPNRVNFILDGKTIGSSTSRIPNTPMHWVLQTETLLSGTVPNNTSGNVQIDRVSVWKYTP